MADEKSKNLTDTEQKTLPVPDKAEAAGAAPTPDKAPAQKSPDKEEKAADAPKEPKAASVSVFNFAEIMAEKKEAEKAAGKSVTQPEAKAPEKAAPAKDTGQKQEKPQEQAQPPKRRGRPPKADKEQAKAPAEKEAPKKPKEAQKPAKPGKTEKTAPADKSKKPEKAPKAPKSSKAAPEVKAPVQSETPPAPAEAPRPAKDEQIVYLKLSDLHAFKNHPFQVRNDEEMKAMVSSVKDKGVTQPAIVRPREDGGYLAHLLEEMEPGELEKLEAVMDFGEHTDSVKDLINLTQNLDCYDFYPGIEDEEALGRMFILDFEAIQVPEHLMDYIDYEAYGRDVHINDSGHFAPGGYVSDNRSHFIEHYTGLDDIPTEYRISNVHARNEKEETRSILAAIKEFKEAPPVPHRDKTGPCHEER